MRRRIVRAVIVTATVTLVGSMLAAMPAQAGTSRTQSRLVEKSASLTTRVNPALGAVSSASLTQDIMNGRVRATIVLSAASTTPGRKLQVGFGHADGAGGCVPQEGAVQIDPVGQGSTVTIDHASPAATQLRWTCAAVVYRDADLGGQLLGGVHGPLVDGQAQLRVSISNARNVKLKKWQTVTFKVTNPGTSATIGVKLEVSGQGVKLRKKTYGVGTIAARSSKNVKVRVRVGSKTDRNLTGSATSTHVSGVWTSSELRVSYQRKKAAPGRYKGSSNVSFNLTRNREVKSFRARLTVRCGGFPAGYSYYTNYYDIPTKKLPKDGRINASHKGRNYTVKLSAVFDGKVVRSGKFTYSGPGSCTGHTAFTAKRR